MFPTLCRPAVGFALNALCIKASQEFNEWIDNDIKSVHPSIQRSLKGISAFVLIYKRTGTGTLGIIRNSEFVKIG